MLYIDKEFLWILLCLLKISFGAKTTTPKLTADEKDSMGNSDRIKMMTLAEELLKDTKVKQRQVQHIRELHSAMLGYEVGIIMGKIREKYKRMMDIYRECQDREAKKNPLRPPGVRYYKPLHWIISMELIRSLEVDIDKLVHVLEMIPKESIRPPPGEEPDEATQTPSSGGKLRSGVNGPPDLKGGGQLKTQPLRTADFYTAPTNSTMTQGYSTPASKFADEEALKQHYRDAYNARSGHDQRWTLDEYYGI